MFESIEDGYYIKIVNVPQVPVDNNNSIVIVYHLASKMYETSNKLKSSHKNKEIALKRLKERVERWESNF